MCLFDDMQRGRFGGAFGQEFTHRFSCGKVIIFAGECASLMHFFCFFLVPISFPLTIGSFQRASLVLRFFRPFPFILSFLLFHLLSN